jgi:hypothetical protein
MSDDRPSDEIDTIAYAVAFLEGAKRLAGDAWDEKLPLVIPFYALIGFSVENGLKAALEHRGVDRSIHWFHSHDLTRLRGLAWDQGLRFLPNINEFIDNLSPQHKEHHFRYPQNARSADLLKADTALILTDAMLRMVFDFIDGHARVDQG